MFHERHKQILALLVSLAHLLLMMMITSCGEPAYAGPATHATGEGHALAPRVERVKQG